MKTLTQIEPRTLIDSLPFNVTRSGSYYLTGDLVGNAAQDGIVIGANNVTLDLNGFSVIGSSAGIRVDTSAGVIGGIVIRNGTVKGCGNAGINLSSVQKCHLEQLLICDNGGNGISVGGSSILNRCISSGNTGNGIQAGDSSAVFNCIAKSNAADGIVVTSQCRVIENIADNNGAGGGQAGLRAAGRSNRIEGNHLSENNGYGLKADGSDNLIIKNSVCGSAIGDYEIAPGNNYGQILVAPGAGFSSSNPWANFACQPSGGGCMGDVDCSSLDTACSRGVCVQGTCVTQARAAGTLCDDGQFCTQNDTCDGQGQCVGTLRNCDDGNPCTADSCDNATVSCVSTPVPNGTACGAGICNNGVCQSSSCTDGVRNGNETGVDCGGGACPPCGNGSACIVNNDCASGLCQNGFCQPACPDRDGDGFTDFACGGTDCNDTNPDINPAAVEVCDGSDNDCNGVVDNLGTITCGTGACQRTVQACVNGQPQTCTPGTPSMEVCDAIDNDCDGTTDEGVTCSIPNAASQCFGGQCVFISCNPGFADCNGNVADGCEVNVSSNAAHCGACNNSCSIPNALSQCSNGQCFLVSCNAGFADCNGNVADGCEVNISSDSANCGACNNVCPTGMNCVNAQCQ